MSSLQIKELEKSFKIGRNEEKILKSIDFELEEGKITALVGTSGSGKSTLLTIAAGLQKSSGGKIKFNDKDLTDMSSSKVRDVRAKEFGFVFQHAHLVPFLSVKDQLNLMIDTAELKWRKKEKQQRIQDILETVDMWKHRDSDPDQLSGGEKQRVAIARAIIHEPKLLFADEPTASLDSKRSVEVMELIRSLSIERNITVLMVTHDEDMLVYADRTVEMKDGKIEK
ncbi:ABC transporter ATP-binding protein [Lacicoccus qingdaonensis]|uniref:Putative hemin import ATP-binding protein HrtA n=1 Tax=Lacicoccus qingdaonensis TaxID=576118 RepID=A0A1G9EPD3_9BACL|nr:ABC transporter ATP-binding protein [Salinicoccus qingdaonensis]SDK78077.1 putative ABC transport system ATP-binding protein [Salinicoccus qingdaonensis]